MYERKRFKIPIFLKLAVLSALLIVLTISVISTFTLKKQKEQFVNQLIGLGESLLRMAASNADDKLLGDEELDLIQLVNDIAQNEQVVYALITDTKGMVKAHSLFHMINKPYVAPKGMERLKTSDHFALSVFRRNGEDLLFLERDLVFRKVKVGHVRLAMSQQKILMNIRSARTSIWILTIVIVISGILLSFGVSLYFSRPIMRLRESAETLGMGHFEHRVQINRNDELGDLALAFNRMAEGLSEREVIRETFGKYVSPQIRDEILYGEIPLDGEIRVATILFSDLRDFTPYVSDHSPSDVIKGIREYFTAMESAISRYDGLILQYAGDEIEAVFGVPIPCRGHEEKAVLAAIEMRKALEMLNNKRGRKGLATFRHGIGIHTGEVLAGNTGSEDRLSYTLIGETVNLASRIQIQDLTKDLDCDILLSEQTVKRVERAFKLKKEPPQRVKGYDSKVVVYQLIA